MVRVFSKREYDRRYERVRELMKEKKLDALFITGEENYNYFTGGASMSVHRSNTRPHATIVPLDGEPIVIADGGREHIIREAGVVKDFRSYGNIVTGIPHEMLVKAVKDTNLQYNRIGSGFGLEMRLGMPYKDFVTLTKSFPRVEFVDATDIIWKMRMVKSKDEVELMRKACDITGRARQKTFDEIVEGGGAEGLTEREIQRIFSKNMYLEGADRVSFIHLSSKEPRDSNYLYHDRKLERGDLLYLDGGAEYRRYTCDFCRLATVGKASEKQIKNHKLLLEINQIEADALKPGLKCSELRKIANKALRERGIERPEEFSRLGHGQGMMLTEPPSITLTDHTVLEPGFTLSTEPHITYPSAGLTWEEVYVITEDGHEQLSTENTELRKI